MKRLFVITCFVMIMMSVEGAQMKLGMHKEKVTPSVEESGIMFDETTPLANLIDATRMRLIAADDTFDAMVINTRNIWYKSYVTLGTPPQPFLVTFDTGSDEFWVPKVGCNSSGAAVSNCAAQSPVYNPTASSSSVALNSSFSIAYGLGSASGHLFNDTFAIGNAQGDRLPFPRPITFGAASSATFYDGGIFGLGFPVAGHPTPPFIQGVLQAVFDAPIFTAYFGDCDLEVCDDGGQLTFGGVDTENCESDVTWVDVANASVYWKFKLDSVSAGFYSSIGGYAITDTGTSYLIVPKAAINSIALAIGASARKGSYYAPCTAVFTLTFMINDRPYSLHADDMFIGAASESGECLLALGAGSFDFFILGDVFARLYCQIYDVQRRRVGFSTLKNATSKTASTILPTLPTIPALPTLPTPVTIPTIATLPPPTIATLATAPAIVTPLAVATLPTLATPASVQTAVASTLSSLLPPPPIVVPPLHGLVGGGDPPTAAIPNHPPSSSFFGPLEGTARGLLRPRSNTPPPFLGPVGTPN